MCTRTMFYYAEKHENILTPGFLQQVAKAKMTEITPNFRLTVLYLHNADSTRTRIVKTIPDLIQNLQYLLYIKDGYLDFLPSSE